MPTMVFGAKDATEQTAMANALIAAGWKQETSPSGDTDVILTPNTDAAKASRYFATDYRLTRGLAVQRVRVKKLA